MSVVTQEWTMPPAWADLTQDQIETGTRNGWHGGVPQMVQHIHEAGLMAAWYAWGQLDAGVALPIPYVGAGGRSLSGTDAVLAFKYLYETCKRDLIAGVRMSHPSVQDAWANFVLSEGTTVNSLLVEAGLSR